MTAPTNETSNQAGTASLPPADSTSHNDRILSVLYRFGLLGIVAATIAFFAITEPAFGTYRNFLIILQTVAITAIVALGVTHSLVVGGFDLSIGANVGFVVMATTLVMVRFELPGVVAVLVGLACGVLIGLANGLLIVKARIPDLLATLGLLFVLQGAALFLTEGQSVATGAKFDGVASTGVIDDFFRSLGQGKVLGIPAPVIVMAVLAVSAYVFLEHTKWGRSLYAIGGNPEAARLAGVPVDRYRVLAYVISGLFASIGGILLAARLGRGDVGAGAPFLLDAVAAALIGFAVLGLNKPNALGSLVGAVFVGVLLNGLTMRNWPFYTQDLAQGLLLVAALLLSFGLKRSSR